MCETSKIAFVAICVRSSYKMPGLKVNQVACGSLASTVSDKRKRQCQ